jgi:hypothetical protein
MSIDLNNKNINIKAVAKKALKNDKLLATLLDSLWSKNETIRYNCHKVLFLLTQEQPRTLYSKWDYFEEFLESDNTYHKLSAVLLLANLTQIDKDNKFERLFDRYYDLLDDKSFITAAYVAGASGKIARAKPRLRTRITNRLLNIDKTHHNPERKDLVKASIIEAFEEYINQTRNKNRIVDFVQQQLNCRSPKTKKAAKEFLARFNQPDTKSGSSF